MLMAIKILIFCTIFIGIGHSRSKHTHIHKWLLDSQCLNFLSEIKFCLSSLFCLVIRRRKSKVGNKTEKKNHAITAKDAWEIMLNTKEYIQFNRQGSMAHHENLS
jgi:hypothetical protein